MARQLIADLSVSATTTTDLLRIDAGRRPWVLFAWQFETPSGSGSNYLTVTAKHVANPESDASAEVTFDVDVLSMFTGPRVIDNTMVAAATSSKFKSLSRVPNYFDFLKLTFTYGGGGTRVFRVNLWAR